MLTLELLSFIFWP
jgi:hypothetical protein